MIQTNKKYLLLSLGLLLIEVLIAVFVKDAFIRPYFGDFLAAILVYSILKSFSTISTFQAATISLLFSYMIEFMQLLDFLHFAGLQDYKVIRIVLGSSFSWEDMLAYTLGIVCVLLIEKRRINPKPFTNE